MTSRMNHLLASCISKQEEYSSIWGLRVQEFASPLSMSLVPPNFICEISAAEVIPTNGLTFNEVWNKEGFHKGKIIQPQKLQKHSWKIKMKYKASLPWLSRSRHKRSS